MSKLLVVLAFLVAVASASIHSDFASALDLGTKNESFTYTTVTSVNDTDVTFYKLNLSPLEARAFIINWVSGGDVDGVSLTLYDENEDMLGVAAADSSTPTDEISESDASTAFSGIFYVEVASASATASATLTWGVDIPIIVDAAIEPNDDAETATDLGATTMAATITQLAEITNRPPPYALRFDTDYDYYVVNLMTIARAITITTSMPNQQFRLDVADNSGETYNSYSASNNTDGSTTTTITQSDVYSDYWNGLLGSVQIYVSQYGDYSAFDSYTLVIDMSTTCADSPCLNGGWCTDLAEMNATTGLWYECMCMNLHDGLNCQDTKPSACDVNDPCTSGGTCYSTGMPVMNAIGQMVPGNDPVAVCLCDDTHVGDTCDQDTYEKSYEYGYAQESVWFSVDDCSGTPDFVDTHSAGYCEMAVEGWCFINATGTFVTINAYFDQDSAPSSSTCYYNEYFWYQQTWEANTCVQQTIMYEGNSYTYSMRFDCQTYSYGATEDIGSGGVYNYEEDYTNYCSSADCENGGGCTWDPSEDYPTAVCICPPGYLGAECELQTNGLVLGCDGHSVFNFTDLHNGVCDEGLNCESSTNEHGGTVEVWFDWFDCQPDNYLWSCTAVYLNIKDQNSVVTASYLGDGGCDSGLNCAFYDWDNGDCNGTTISNCAGTALVDSTMRGNGVCDLSLNCLANLFDDGDCGDMINTCDGTSSVNVTTLKDGSCNLALNCSEALFDGGACLPNGELLACDGVTMVDGMKWMNGVCNYDLNCEENMWDGGDCTPFHVVQSCDPAVTGTYQYSYLAATNCGDNYCDYSLACTEYDFDCGDCTWEPPVVTDCNGMVVNETDISTFCNLDGVCEMRWNCSEWFYDCGDCLPETGPEQYDCTGAVTSTAAIVAAYSSGMCVEEFNCLIYGFSFGNCALMNCNGANVSVADIELQLQPPFVCNDDFNCEAYGFDFGICPPPAPVPYVALSIFQDAGSCGDVDKALGVLYPVTGVCTLVAGLPVMAACSGSTTVIKFYNDLGCQDENTTVTADANDMCPQFVIATEVGDMTLSFSAICSTGSGSGSEGSTGSGSGSETDGSSSTGSDGTGSSSGSTDMSSSSSSTGSEDSSNSASAQTVGYASILALSAALLL